MQNVQIKYCIYKNLVAKGMCDICLNIHFNNQSRVNYNRLKIIYFLF